MPMDIERSIIKYRILIMKACQQKPVCKKESRNCFLMEEQLAVHMEY